jgi:hypothetical protein
LIDVEDGGQFPDDLQADVGHRSFDPAHVDTIDFGVVGQLFLGEFPGMPEAVAIRRETRRLAAIYKSQPTHSAKQPESNQFAFFMWARFRLPLL